MPYTRRTKNMKQEDMPDLDVIVVNPVSEISHDADFKNNNKHFTELNTVEDLDPDSDLVV